MIPHKIDAPGCRKIICLGVGQRLAMWIRVQSGARQCVRLPPAAPVSMAEKIAATSL
jgi:hypothetical protein